ncbi:MAG: ABC transporter permease [Clostridium sp.]
MDNNYLDISKRNLLLNKKRSILLIVGIMISVALMTAMATFFYSVSEYQIKSYREEGDYHVAYKEISQESIDIIKNYSSVENYSIYENIGQFKIGNKLNTFLKCDENTLKMQGFTLEGNLPSNENEVAVNVSDYTKYGKEIVIGDTIEVDYNGVVKSLKITGIIKGKTYKMSQIAVVNNDMKGVVNATVKIKEDKNLRTNLDNLNAKVSPGHTTQDVDGGIEEHNSLLAGLGASKYSSINESMMIIVIVLFSIVIASTVIMIFNAFNITIMERIKEYGLLKAVGSTPSQVRSLVFYEAGIIGLIAIPLGIIFGFFGLKIFFGLFGGYLAMEIKNIEILFSAKVMVASVGLGIITVFLSALFPTIRAGKISPLECINDSTIKIKKVPKGRLTNKLLKIEGLLAFRNRKINKKRYYITVMAMTVSIAMFISIAATLKNSMLEFEEYRSIDNFGEIDVSRGYSNDGNDNYNDFYNEYSKTLKGEFAIIDETVNVYMSRYVEGFVKPEMAVNSTNRIDVKKDNVIYKRLPFSIKVIDKTSQKFFKESIKDFSYDELVKNKSVILVNEAKTFNNVDGKYGVNKIINANVGDEIYLTYFDGWKETEDIKKFINKSIEDAAKVKVGYTMSAIDSNNTPTVYIPIENLPFKEVFYLVNQENEEKQTKIESRRIDDVMAISIDVKDDADKEELKVLREKVNKDFNNIGYVTDKYAMREERRAEILTIKIFVYCFIGIVSLISALNIINTVSTNIILRKKELSALRAIGTPYEGIRKMLLMEGLMYGLTSAVFGTIIGVALNYYLINVTANVFETTYSLPIIEILIAFGGAVLLGIISILIPLKKMKNISIIEGIRTLD